MSMTDCILRAVVEGRLSEEKAAETLTLYDELAEDLRNTMHADAADIEAARRTTEAIRFDLLEKKRRELLRIKSWQRINMNMKQYRNARGEEDYGAAMLAHFDRDDMAGFSNIDARRKAILGRLHAGMDEFLAKHRRNLAGAVRDQADLEDVVRELFGADTGNNAAKEMSQAWTHTAEKARMRFNAAGGHIPKRKDWGMPQTHDSLAVGKVKFGEWREFIIDKLDPAKMINERTNLPMTRPQLEIALREVYDTIRTEGLNKMTPSGAGGGKSMANRHADHRFLVFKDPDSWLAYNQRFGGNDPFSVMMAHLDGMARDIASMEILGPNPQSTIRYMQQTAVKWASDTGKEETFFKSVNSQVKAATDMWNTYTGASNAPVNGKVARGFAGLRSTLQSAQLGAAFLSALTDLNFQRMARMHAGLDQAKIIPQQLKLMNPRKIEDQKLAVRLGLIAENWSTVASGQQRYIGEINGGEISRRLADVVMRISGLSPWTQAGRWSFGMEFMGTLADSAGTAFDQLAKPLQETFKRYGIDPQRWDAMRASALYEHEGATFLRPEDIANRTDLPPGYADDLAMRLLEMIQSETEFAVPATSLRGRSTLTADAAPGTWKGELIRSVAMYKNFSVTLYHTQLTRMVQQKGLMSKGRYAANLFISTTLMGGMAMQLKEMAKGKDPKPMYGESALGFWGKALLQGGGLGIFGDFLGASVTNRFGGSMGATVAGPVVSWMGDTAGLTGGNLVQLAQGDKTNFGSELTNYLKRYTPGSSLWYARLAFERLVFDEIQKAIDPDALDRFRRQEDKLKREHGQKFWWRPGKRAPDRAPDISNVVEE